MPNAVKVQAEAEAEANQLIADSLTEQLVRYKEISQWDGALPNVYGGSEPRPFIDMTDAAQ